MAVDEIQKRKDSLKVVVSVQREMYLGKGCKRISLNGRLVWRGTARFHFHVIAWTSPKQAGGR